MATIRPIKFVEFCCAVGGGNKGPPVKTLLRLGSGPTGEAGQYYEARFRFALPVGVASAR